MSFCNGISEIMPPEGSSADIINCYHAQYLAYTTALAACNNDEQCCAGITSDYYRGLINCNGTEGCACG